MKTCLSFLTVLALVFFPNIHFGQAPNLSSAGNFTLFTTTGEVKNTGISQVIGNLGTNAGPITGFNAPTLLSGIMYIEDAVTAQGSIDLLSGWNQLNDAAQTIFPSHAAVLGNGEVLTAGVYLIPSAASIEGVLTLDAEDDPNAIFIIKIQGAFSPGPSSQILLVNGALVNNVFWVVNGGAIAIATLNDLKGIFIAHPGAITMATGSTLEGRLLSTTGAITIHGSTVHMPGVVVPVTLTDFTASKANNAIELLWTVANEFSLEKYEMERSADGRNFYKIGSVPATNAPYNQTYSWLDITPCAQIGFYRLKIIDADHFFKYSGVIKIDLNSMKGISVYPNPVINHTVMLEMYGQLKGDYIINLYNIQGKEVAASRIIHDGHDAVRSIAFDKNLPKGIYYLVIKNSEKYREKLTVLLN